MVREKTHIVETVASVEQVEGSFHHHILFRMSIVSQYALNSRETVNTGYETSP